MSLKPEQICIDCPRCFGTGKVAALTSLQGAVSQQDLDDCWACIKAAEKKAKREANRERK